MSVGLYAAAYAVTGSGVPRGTTVLGVDIGGLTVTAAEARLAKELPAVTTRTVTVTAGTQTFTLDASSSGLGVDAKETVARAGSRSLDPGTLLPALFGATDRLEPVLTVDETVLAGAVAKIADKVDRKVKEGKVRFVDGAAKATKARDGRELDVDETSATLRRVFEAGGSEATAPVTVTAPRIGTDAVNRAMREFAEPAMSGPLAVEVSGKSIALLPGDLDDYLTMTPSGRTLLGTIDTETVAEDLTSAPGNCSSRPRTHLSPSSRAGRRSSRASRAARSTRSPWVRR